MNPNEIKILESCTSQSWGGMEMRVLKTSQVFIERGHDVTILCFPDSRLHFEAQKLNIKCYPLKFANGIHLTEIKKLRSSIEKEKLEIIHSQFSRDLRFIVPALGRKKPKIPLVLTKRVGSYISKKDIFHKYLYKKVDLVTAISNVIRQNVIDTCPVKPEKVKVIYNGINPEEYKKAFSNRTQLREKFQVAGNCVIGMAARFTPGKGHETFLQAVKQVANLSKNLKFWIIGEESFGEEDYAKQIYNLSDTLNLKGNIEFLGFRKDLPDLLAAMDILVVPSHAEAFGNIAIEGMAVELPVIASNTDGLLDIVINGETGIHFTPGDSGQLADALNELILNPDKRKIYGKAGKRRVENLFDEKTQFDKLEKIFLQLAGK
ncbi:MAG: glycosyltransferase family 4 protein [Melioribacteraceae bacterium]|nr:glycosyltransferase family 4 protein [Melioribacteraceae bacterium]MCF8431483.1 glycosyltransferase family 4 protein [Melioribacteraceae bacterium]